MPTLLVTGASRGLGLEFTRQYLMADWQVHACARDPDAGELAGLARSHKSLHRHRLDVTDPAAIGDLAAALKDVPLDVLINNAGIYGPKDNFEGRGQNLASMNYDLWRKAFETNTIAPYKMTQAFAPNLQKAGPAKVVMISSEVASLPGMKSAGMTVTCYQSSKAALNMAGICLAHELRPMGIAVLLLHPGWVRTDMGGPAAPVDARDSVTGMRQVIADFSLKDTAAYRDYRGRKLAW